MSIEIVPPAGFMQSVKAEINAYVGNVRTMWLNYLNLIGKEAVNIARSEHKYLDQTGNLTSSIGYVIVEDGKIIQEGDFTQVKNGAEGVTEGRALARNAAADYPQGYTLIVVAGMKYAAYVEKMKLGGLTAGELHARNRAKEIINQLKML